MSAAYPLLRLRALYQRREDAAWRAAACKEREMRHAEQQATAREKALEAFHQWRTEEEARRYARVLGRDLDREALNMFKAGLMALLRQEQEKEEQYALAAQALEECHRAWQAAVKAAQTARREVLKLDMHKEHWQLEQKLEDERKEEVELEDHAVRPLPGGRSADAPVLE